MLGISAWVVSRHWPAGGMPWLAWPVHAAALATVTAEIVTRALKIQASARACGIPLGFGTALRVCLAGDFAAAITPARSGAEPSRFLVLAESGTGPAQRVLVLFLELFLEMWSLVLVCTVLAVLFRGRGASASGLLALVGGYSTFVLGAGAVGWFLSRRNANGPPPPWAMALRLTAARWRAVQRTLRALREAVHSLRTANPALMLLAFGGSVLHVCFKVATLPMLVFLGDPTFALSMDSLAPLRRLGREAEHVTASRLDRRLTSGDLPVEVAELAHTLNDMLARLEDSFRRLSELSSDLAHELRTPLSNLMTQTQVGLSRARSADDYREVLANNSEELERLARMVSDMLFLAKSEHGLAQPVRQAVDLQDMVRQVLSFYEALATEQHLGLVVEGSATVAGDRSLLVRALANLVSNAIRHASAESRVSVVIEPAPLPPSGGTPCVRLSVCNQGETVAPEVLARMFDRFYRADSSRRHDTEGAGLGLAIVRSIALAHGGTADASSQAGRTCVWVDLPAE